MALTVTYDESIVDEGGGFYKHFGGTVGVRSVTLSVKVAQIDPGSCIRIKAKIEKANGQIDWDTVLDPVTRFKEPRYEDIDLATNNGFGFTVLLSGQDKNVLYEVTLVGLGNGQVFLSSQLDSL